MKQIWVECSIGIALIAALGYFGWQLGRSVRTLRQQPRRQQLIFNKSQQTVFTAEAGIDVWGTPVSPLPPPQAKRTIVFMVRGSSAEQDLSFWRSVESLLPKNDGIRLVGYCDGKACVNTVRREANPIDFPVIAYGELDGSQALLNEDARGHAVLRSEQWFIPKSIAWRSPARTPRILAKEISQ